MKKQKIILFVLLTAALWGVPYKAASQIFAVRANALAACSATLNVGAEAALTDNWSLEMSGYWNPVLPYCRTEPPILKVNMPVCNARSIFL